jgi:hypothetical protein
MSWWWWVGGSGAVAAVLLLGNSAEASVGPTPTLPPPDLPPLPLPQTKPNQGILRVSYRLDLPGLAKFSSKADPKVIHAQLVKNSPGFSEHIRLTCPGAPLLGNKPTIRVVAHGSDRIVEMLYLATFSNASDASGAIRPRVLECVRKAMKGRSSSLKKYMKDLTVVRVR